MKKELKSMVSEMLLKDCINRHKKDEFSLEVAIYGLFSMVQGKV